jgi:hypothetical protein
MTAYIVVVLIVCNLFPFQVSTTLLPSDKAVQRTREYRHTYSMHFFNFHLIFWRRLIMSYY